MSKPYGTLFSLILKRRDSSNPATAGHTPPAANQPIAAYGYVPNLGSNRLSGDMQMFATTPSTVSSLSLSDRGSHMLELNKIDSHTTGVSTLGVSNRSLPAIPDQAGEGNSRNTFAEAHNTHRGAAQHLRTIGRRSSSSTNHDTESVQSSLILAIRSGERDLVEFFLRDGADIEGRDGRSGWTPTIWAVYWNRNDILSTLVRSGADLTATDEKTGRTPLLWAVSFGYCRAVEILLEGSKQALEIVGEDRMTPLALAYFNGQLEIARKCMEAGANTDIHFSRASLLEWAITRKDEEFARLLLEHCATADRYATDGISILIHAMHQGLPEIAQLLVQKGANPNSGNKDGDAPLILAIQYGYASLAEVLIAEGANTQTSDRHGFPVLTLAVKAQQKNVVKSLLEIHTDTETRDPYGFTALLWAIQLKDAPLVKLLVDHNADVTVQDSKGATAQFWAAWTGSEDIINLVRIRGGQG